MTVAVLTSLLVVIGLLVIGLSVAVISFKDLTDRTLNSIDRAHDRWVGQTNDLLDRLMAKSWEELTEIRAFEAESEGGFFRPDEQEEDDEGEYEQLVPGRFGTMQPMGGVPRPDADTEKLLAEDFDDDMMPRRQSG